MTCLPPHIFPFTSPVTDRVMRLRLREKLLKEWCGESSGCCVTASLTPPREHAAFRALSWREKNKVGHASLFRKVQLPLPSFPFTAFLLESQERLLLCFTTIKSAGDRIIKKGKKPTFWPSNWKQLDKERNYGCQSESGVFVHHVFFAPLFFLFLLSQHASLREAGLFHSRLGNSPPRRSWSRLVSIPPSGRSQTGPPPLQTRCSWRSTRWAVGGRRGGENEHFLQVTDIRVHSCTCIITTETRFKCKSGGSV